ncbi:McrC family protein [Nocardia terpenica]|uniref:Restriction endonuclease n=1 Tax=Nocardia terpenica TaxID=455432 RepID=A0A291RQC2_9NOCA|nr:restriction endonuclease [Nocardia terpenica]ATL69424.1 restriction endonuclease [Nocardia terpenica]
MNPIELEEYTPRTVALDKALAVAVLRAQIVKIEPCHHPDDHWQLTSMGKVGTVTVRAADGRTVTLAMKPRIPVRRLLFLIGYVRNPKGWRDENIRLGTESDLVSVMAVLFERYASKALRQGRLVSGYRTVEDSGTVVRGRVREADQIRRHLGRVLPVETTNDILGEDVTENRILRTACDRLLALSDILPEKVHEGLRTIRARLDRITPLEDGKPLPGWRRTVADKHLRETLGIAELVLRNSSVERVRRAGDSVTVAGFVFQMSTVFQDFIVVALREELRARGIHCQITPKDRYHLDDHGHVPVQPDFIGCDSDGTPLCVADVKYKPEKHPKSDAYQMLAYCVGLGLSEGHLIYPRGEDLPPAFTVSQADVVIHHHAIDLDEPRIELLAQIGVLADRLLRVSGSDAL